VGDNEKTKIMKKQTELPEKKLEVTYVYHEAVEMHQFKAVLNGEQVHITTMREHKEQAAQELFLWCYEIGIYLIIRNL
jgi:hypothetical protein